jgi:hypothetical protein
LKQYFINPEVIVSELEGAKTIFNPNTGLYFGLDEVGTKAWDLIVEGPINLEELVVKITAEFDVSKVLLESDLFHLLEQLYKEDLIHVYDI